jgi:hypothetical protein
MPGGLGGIGGCAGDDTKGVGGCAGGIGGCAGGVGGCVGLIGPPGLEPIVCPGPKLPRDGPPGGETGGTGDGPGALSVGRGCGARSVRCFGGPSGLLS